VRGTNKGQRCHPWNFGASLQKLAVNNESPGKFREEARESDTDDDREESDGECDGECDGEWEMDV
jgi:hypothetical protein